MPRVMLTARAGMRYEGVRYVKGDIFTVSDSFLAAHPSRLTVVAEEVKKRKPRKKVETAPEPEAQAIEVSSNADYHGDSSGL